MKEVIVTQEVLDLYDEYDGDFGLLDERWAPQKDRDKLTSQQIVLFSEYVDKLHWLKVINMSKEMRASAEARVAELEEVIDPGVVEVMRKKVKSESRAI